MPCWPVPVGTWISPAPRTVVGGVGVLASGGTCVCAYGGTMSVQMPGALRSQVS
jgi:hypothetical protein